MSLCKLTHTEIKDLIPHRDPFLFLERAEVESDNEISEYALWPHAHPILQGHFPQKPVVPGICLLEAGAQLAGVLLHWRSQKVDEAKKGFGVLASVQNAKFKQALMAEQQLALHCRVRLLSSRATWVQCYGKFSGQPVFESELILALKSSENF